MSRGRMVKNMKMHKVEMNTVSLLVVGYLILRGLYHGILDVVDLVGKVFGG